MGAKTASDPASFRLRVSEIEAARTIFAAKEPRDLFYRAAARLVELAVREKQGNRALAEAVAVLLLTWNKEYYRFRPINEQHFTDIERLLADHPECVGELRPRSIDELGDADEANTRKTFNAFANVLGRVGAAKCLHLLAPRFFPLWDAGIALYYGCEPTPGRQGDGYWRFMLIVKRQVEDLRRQGATMPDLLKAIDEYNYCKHTKKWI